MVISQSAHFTVSRSELAGVAHGLEAGDHSHSNTGFRHAAHQSGGRSAPTRGPQSAAGRAATSRKVGALAPEMATHTLEWGLARRFA